MSKGRLNTRFSITTDLSSIPFFRLPIFLFLIPDLFSFRERNVSNVRIKMLYELPDRRKASEFILITILKFLER